MRIARDLATWRRYRKETQGSLGFVPTMGALHDGHLALVERSLAENAVTVVSIFVNPTQFDEKSDLAKYPRPFEEDLAMLARAGVDLVLAPDYREMYPDDFRYAVDESELSRILCGAHRPGHFRGMMTVVLKLLNLVKPDRAYFGEKDFQQLELVRGMVEAFFMDVRIIAHETVREADGLALSSRNARLSPEERRRAPLLREILASAADTNEARSRLESNGFRVDYVEEHGGRRLAAARLGETRLIDNVVI